jgi:hypothetical protein
LAVVFRQRWLVESAAAVGADLGERCLVDLVDLLGGRWLAVGLGAIVLARLAAWLAGVRLGLALAKGLALAGMEGRVELPAGPLVLGLKLMDPSLKGLTVGTPDLFHAGIIRGSGTCSCAAGGRRMVQLELGA